MMTEINPIWQKKAEVILDSLQLSGNLMSYADFAETVGIELPHRIHKLTTWLEETICADVASGHTPRAAVVISKSRGIPAPGFFILLKELGLYAGADTGPEAAAFHKTCLEKLATPASLS